MNVLTTENLSKKYKGTYAVRDVSMHIEKGDIYGFVGENGAGKTTVIRMITGLASPDSGSYSLYDVPYNAKDIYGVRAKTGAIVETATMSRNMTAVENLKFQCGITGVKKTDEELEGLLKKVGLDVEAIRKKNAGNFSLGMRQRLGIAMVMVSDPDFVVLDEPMNGLDPQGFIEVRETIMNLHEEGVTFLISSHILAELEKICTKIGMISHGELLEEITMEELHKNARRQIIIESEDQDAVYALLQANPAFPEVVKEGTRVILYGDVDLNKVMQLLVGNGITVESLNTVQETIEDHYIKLLGRGKI